MTSPTQGRNDRDDETGAVPLDEQAGTTIGATPQAPEDAAELSDDDILSIAGGIAVDSTPPPPPMDLSPPMDG